MQIISHRGYWLETSEKNSVTAFKRSFQNGLGLETDIRDFQGKLVVSHAIPDGPVLLFEEFLQLYQTHGGNLTLALNIKSCGLYGLLKELLSRYQITNYFTFDMTVPDTLWYLNTGINAFARQSECEPSPAFYERINGIWLDGFYGDWWTEVVVQQHLDNHKKVCIVSPELHRREHLPIWEKIRCSPFVKDDNLFICTDIPQQAEAYFKDYL